MLGVNTPTQDIQTIITRLSSLRRSAKLVTDENQHELVAVCPTEYQKLSELLQELKKNTGFKQ